MFHPKASERSHERLKTLAALGAPCLEWLRLASEEIEILT